MRKTRWCLITLLFAWLLNDLETYHSLNFLHNWSIRIFKTIKIIWSLRTQIYGFLRETFYTVWKWSCADPESFVRDGPIFVLFLVDEDGGSKYHYKRAIIGMLVKRHLNGVSLACWWWLNIECCLSGFMIFRGSGLVLLRKPIFLWFFRAGVRLGRI